MVAIEATLTAAKAESGAQRCSHSSIDNERRRPMTSGSSSPAGLAVRKNSGCHVRRKLFSRQLLLWKTWLL